MEVPLNKDMLQRCYVRCIKDKRYFEKATFNILFYIKLVLYHLGRMLPTCRSVCHLYLIYPKLIFISSLSRSQST